LLEGCPIVTAHSTVPRHLLLACTPLGGRLGAERVIEALAAGIGQGGMAESDGCPLPDGEIRGADARVTLDERDFDARMLAARAVVIAVERLHERTLAGSIAFEIATRARQSGVPCYAVARENSLTRFDERILDLQAVIQAADAAALRRAGRRLARIA
jgi:hypothetical protein